MTAPQRLACEANCPAMIDANQHLRELFSAEIKAAREALDGKIRAVEAGIIAAKEAMDGRMDSHNNLLAYIRTIQDSQMDRREYQIGHAALISQFTELDRWKSKQEGKASKTSVLWAYMIGAVGVALSIIHLIVSLLHR